MDEILFDNLANNSIHVSVKIRKFKKFNHDHFLNLTSYSGAFAHIYLLLMCSGVNPCLWVSVSIYIWLWAGIYLFMSFCASVVYVNWIRRESYS